MRLGLARDPGDPLWRVVEAADWQPVSFYVTRFLQSGAPNPCPKASLALVLSPEAARAADLPKDLPCIATGTATADLLRRTGRSVQVAPSPDAEGIWKTLCSHLPEGGEVLLVRGARSRGYLEQISADSPWRLHPWITHRETPVEPFPMTPGLDAVLALSPLQAERMALHCSHLRRLAWGSRTGEAFLRSGVSPTAICEPRAEALQRLLETWVSQPD